MEKEKRKSPNHQKRTRKKKKRTRRRIWKAKSKAFSTRLERRFQQTSSDSTTKTSILILLTSQTESQLVDSLQKVLRDYIVIRKKISYAFSRLIMDTWSKCTIYVPKAATHMIKRRLNRVLLDDSSFQIIMCHQLKRCTIFVLMRVSFSRGWNNTAI